MKRLRALVTTIERGALGDVRRATLDRLRDVHGVPPAALAPHYTAECSPEILASMGARMAEYADMFDDTVFRRMAEIARTASSPFVAWATMLEEGLVVEADA